MQIIEVNDAHERWSRTGGVCADGQLMWILVPSDFHLTRVRVEQKERRHLDAGDVMVVDRHAGVRRLHSPVHAGVRSRPYIEMEVGPCASRGGRGSG